MAFSNLKSLKCYFFSFGAQQAIVHPGAQPFLPSAFASCLCFPVHFFSQPGLQALASAFEQQAFLHPGAHLCSLVDAGVCEETSASFEIVVVSFSDEVEPVS